MLKLGVVQAGFRKLVQISMFLSYLLLAACGGGDSDGENPEVGFNIAQTSPDNGSGSVIVNSSIEVVFNQKVDATSVNTATFWVIDEHTHEKVKGKITILDDERTVRFKPEIMFFDRHYGVTIHHTITSFDGTHLKNGTVSWNFFTESRPPIFGHSPQSNEIDVSEKATVRVQLERIVNPASVNQSSFFISDNFGKISASMEINDDKLVLIPQSPLASNTTFTVTLDETIIDFDNERLFNSPFIWSFTTRQFASSSIQFGTNFNDEARSVTTDAQGNIYIVGQTDGTFPGQSNAGSYDIFVAKYNANGDQIWLTQTGTEYFDSVLKVMLADNGDLFVAGHSDQPPTIDSTAPTSDVTLIRFDTNGNEFETIKTGSPDGHDFSRGMLTDSAGNIYIIGSTMGTVPGSVGNQGLHDIFIASFDNSGNFRWIKQEGSGSDELVNFATIVDDRIFIATTIIDALPGTIPPPSPGFPPPPFFIEPKSELFSFDLSANKVWNKPFDSRILFNVDDIKSSTNGNLFVNGFGHDGAVVLKLDFDGNEISNSTISNPLLFDTGPLVIDENENYYLATGEFEENSVPQPGYMGPRISLKVTKYNASGTELWSTDIKTENHAEIMDLHITADGKIIATGYTHGRFDGNTMIGTQDAFLFFVDSNGVIQ